MTDNLSFLPFTRPFIDEATIADVVEVLRSGWLTGGPKVAEFESALSDYCSGRRVRVFNSATSALSVALKLAGVGYGDQVITTPLTWVATSNVVIELGAHPVFVDVNAQTRNIDLNAIRAAITPRTRALLPVDLAGSPVNRKQLYDIAKEHQLRVIEDAAQSLGASWDGEPIGTSGDFIVFSFHANKNITSGEGGALVLPADIDVKLCEKLRLQGVYLNVDSEIDVDVLGIKANMTDIAAAIGLGQLRLLNKITEKRRLLAAAYFDQLPNNILLSLPEPNFDNKNWHMFQILLPEHVNRKAFIEAMKNEKIGIGIHYRPIHLFSLYRELGYSIGDFPNAEMIGRRTITLPLFAEMQVTDVHRVCQAIRKVLSCF
jgi:dTDP-4-amino-4,6-dideoxygalactose transaminase